jgi:hypothetical protein
MDFLNSFLSRSGYLAHGYCFTWTPSLLWSMVGADALIAAAYFSIPLAIVSFVRRRVRRDARRFAPALSAARRSQQQGCGGAALGEGSAR